MKLLDGCPLLCQQPPGFVLLAMQPRLFGAVEAAVLLQQVPFLHRESDDPNQVPRAAGGGADVAISARLVTEHRHFRLAGRSQHDDRLFGPAPR